MINGSIEKNGHLKFTKQYIGKHAVEYSGQLNYQTITGSWSIGGHSDTFELTVSNC